jgi:hypothetical protein
MDLPDPYDGPTLVASNREMPGTIRPANPTAAWKSAGLPTGDIGISLSSSDTAASNIDGGAPAGRFVALAGGLGDVSPNLHIGVRNYVHL